MGERLDSFQNLPTAQEKNSLELNEDIFFALSQETEGLSHISEKNLIDFIQTRDNIDDVLYLFKFITDEDMYLKFASEELSSFPNLENKEQKEVKELASLFYSFLTDMPFLCESSVINVGESGTFIAYVNKRVRRLDVSWKNEKGDNHIFNKLLEKANTKNEDYPNKLRSWGDLETFLDEDGIVNIKFSGDAAKKYLNYAPGYLKNFEEEIKFFFQNKFNVEKVKTNF